MLPFSGTGCIPSLPPPYTCFDFLKKVFLIDKFNSRNFMLTKIGEPFDELKALQSIIIEQLSKALKLTVILGGTSYEQNCTKMSEETMTFSDHQNNFWQH